MNEADQNSAANSDACLLLADGTLFRGKAFGANANAIAVGEICFNTAMTGYQEILTDPSYAGQLITFTFPHIGNVGCNDEDIEAGKPHCSGLIVREMPTLPSNFRSRHPLDAWLKKNGLCGIAGVDTRALTRHIRTKGAQNAVIFPAHEEAKAREALKNAPNMNGLDLAKSVTAQKPYQWNETLWQLNPDARTVNNEALKIVAVDYGVKHNILRSLAEQGFRITVVPATATAEEILKHQPAGIFLSNGPGDPAATGEYALPVIKSLIDSGIPIFGICLGHQLLGLALGGKTEKMTQGHRGANHPVKDLASGKVIITSQNHGFAVSQQGLPDDVEVTHVSLFDGTVQGLRHKTKPIFSVQGHPEASPGPHDSFYLFEQFLAAAKSVSQKEKVKAHG